MDEAKTDRPLELKCGVNYIELYKKLEDIVTDGKLKDKNIDLTTYATGEYIYEPIVDEMGEVLADTYCNAESPQDTGQIEIAVMDICKNYGDIIYMTFFSGGKEGLLKGPENKAKLMETVAFIHAKTCGVLAKRLTQQPTGAETLTKAIRDRVSEV